MLTSHRAARALRLLAPLLLTACTTTGPLESALVVGAACPTHSVRYCVGRGEHAEDGLCRCITQADARETLDRL